MFECCCINKLISLGVNNGKWGWRIIKHLPSNLELAKINFVILYKRKIFYPKAIKSQTEKALNNWVNNFCGNKIEDCTQKLVTDVKCLNLTGELLRKSLAFVSLSTTCIAS